jgi:hypothetical protein
MFAPIFVVQMAATTHCWNFAGCTNRRRNPNIWQILRFCGFFYIGGRWLVAPIYWWHYKEKQNVSNTLPTQLSVTYSIGWSKQKGNAYFPR